MSFVEAHGTGTALGDPIEVGSLGAMLNLNLSLIVSLFHVLFHISFPIDQVFCILLYNHIYLYYI